MVNVRGVVLVVLKGAMILVIFPLNVLNGVP